MNADERGDLWLAGPSGIHQVHFLSDSVTDFEIIHHDTKGLRVYNANLAIVEGEIAVGTEKGLYKFVPKGDEKNT
jgi:hypothetical protein